MFCFWLIVDDPSLVMRTYCLFLNLHVHRCPYTCATMPWQGPKYPWCTHVFFCYASAQTKCNIQPGNWILFGKTTYCTSWPFSSFTVEGKWQPELRQGSPNPCTVGMHMSPQMVLKTARHHTLLATHYLYMKISNRHENAYMPLKKACVVKRKWCWSCSPTPELPGTAHQCHFFSCHSKRGEGWFILLLPL